ncbi:MAG: serine--tRNA ligase [candidate division KSB1 bacterium]|nr:serine--tRNA ligase [candidate division KSB1 bacterium]MDZ7319371.1 serine--tRNA ligase [candidate division KSB1 bacterium]MDZ7340751.1 serine--tRNA ligase [candidate division KSB1 bacterium]
MLDIKFIRNNVDRVKKAIELKNDHADIDRLLDLDAEKRKIMTEVEELKHQRNKVSEDIGRMKQQHQDATPFIQEMKKVADRIKQLDDQVKSLDQEMYQILIRIPNVPHESVPIGKDASANVEVKRWGQLPPKDYKPKPHWEVGEKLGIIDFAGGSRVSGSFFINYKGLGARLQRALIAFMLDLHIKKHGYTEVYPPFIVNRESMFGTGQLPKLEDDMYVTSVDDFFLIPTAEVPVTNLLRDQMLKAEDLPIYYTAYTPCFRREAGTYGKDTRGLVRVHQFDKVEMVKFVKPETSYDELEKLLQNAEEVLQLLELPYRVLALSTGDLSFAAAKCYDIEVWADGLGKWLEVSSCSNFEDFQARRANIRFKRDAASKPEYVHTLNGSGLALPRTVIAILENYQTDEGSVMVPNVLREFMGTDIIK